MARYCTRCGVELRGTERYCPDCGEAVQVGDPAPERNRRSRSPADPDRTARQSGDSRATGRSGDAVRTSNGDRGAFRAAIAGAILWAALLGYALAATRTTPGGEPTYAAYAGLFSLVAWLGSIVAMYVDLRSMNRQLWDTRPILWVIAVIVLYLIALPLYVYKRYTAPDLA